MSQHVNASLSILMHEHARGTRVLLRAILAGGVAEAGARFASCTHVKGLEHAKYGGVAWL